MEGIILYIQTAFCLFGCLSASQNLKLHQINLNLLQSMTSLTNKSNNSKQCGLKGFTPFDFQIYWDEILKCGKALDVNKALGWMHQKLQAEVIWLTIRCKCKSESDEKRER